MVVVVETWDDFRLYVGSWQNMFCLICNDVGIANGGRLGDEGVARQQNCQERWLGGRVAMTWCWAQGIGRG